jgi:hypothetical protein
VRLNCHNSLKVNMTESSAQNAMGKPGSRVPGLL